MPPNIPESSSQCERSIPVKIRENVEKTQHTFEHTDSNKSTVNDEKNEYQLEKKSERWFEFQTELIWPNIIGITILHILFVYAVLYIIINPISQYGKTIAFSVLTGFTSGFGVTGGVHRYWTHRTYKANIMLRIILAGCYVMAGMNSISQWVRDHRVHHKFSETDADPHNSNRGFFFSHVGWLMMKKHPEVKRRGKQIDMSDILEDPIVQFVDNNFLILKLLACFILPVAIPVYCWNEDWRIAVLMNILIRYPFTLNSTWAVNSFAHIYGNRRYNHNIGPAENKWVSFFAMGEGWHNYHHTFPWDYKTAELGNYRLNFTTMILDAFAKIGWATDLKTAPKELVQKVVENRGDGSRIHWNEATD